jgi:membrane protease subunit HflK
MAWNEPGNGQRDPWGKNRQSGNKPNLDDLLKTLKARVGKLGGGPGGIFTIVLALLLAWLLLSSYTIVNTSEAGVVLRFGQYSRTLNPGFHFKLPNPLETVQKVETTRVRSMSDQVRMLTSDENIIAVDFNVQYQASDARKYLYSTSDPEETLRQASEAAVRAVVGAHSMDDILTSPSDQVDATPVAPAAAASSAAAAAAAVIPATPAPKADKITLQQETRDVLQHTLDSYDAGLLVTDVSFQNVAPPQEVKAAFDDVNAAREDKQSTVNEAYAYANQVIPQATGDASRIAAQASGYKSERIARAQGDTQRFNLLLKEYQAAPEVTRRRLWLETMEEVLANNPKVIDGSGGRNIINLPFDRAAKADAVGNGVSAGVTATPDNGNGGAQP